LIATMHIIADFNIFADANFTLVHMCNLPCL